MIKASAFQIKRGTRQGCPLTPLLFLLAIEPLAALIRSSGEIKGLMTGGLEEKVSLYADYMLIYLEDPQSSLPALLEIIQRFGHFSGFRVNWDKSLLFQIDQETPITLPPECPLQIVHTLISWGPDKKKHPNSSYAKINLDPLISRIKKHPENME